MQKIVFMLNAAPYGSERVLSSLRLAAALCASEIPAQVRVFLLSDAVPLALAGQQVASGQSLGDMLDQLLAVGADVRVCRTCVEARGLQNAEWLDGVEIGTMPELAEWTLEADKVISF